MFLASFSQPAVTGTRRMETVVSDQRREVQQAVRREQHVLVVSQRLDQRPQVGWLPRRDRRDHQMRLAGSGSTTRHPGMPLRVLRPHS